VTSSLQPTRILVLAEDALARAGLALLLGDQPECQVVGQAGWQGDLEEELEAGEPDVILWDLGWDPDLALERLAELADALPPVAVLLPGQGSGEQQASQAWRAGARAMLLRDTAVERLAAGLGALAHGLVVIDRDLAGDLLLADMPPGSEAQLVEELTPREVEVLQLLAEGLPNKAIARRLEISEHTVKFHVNAILAKLGAQSRTEAVVRATRMGLILL
jgi:DNA-binding NarL/FixJ family response regulator